MIQKSLTMITYLSEICGILRLRIRIQTFCEHACSGSAIDEFCSATLKKSFEDFFLVEQC
jgi:hypothetical protein